MTNPVVPPAGSSSMPKVTRLKRLGAYARAHWKELLAIGLAAVPVAFLLFHKGTQQAAQAAVSYPAALFGGGSAADTSGTSQDATPPADPPATVAGAGTLARTRPWYISPKLWAYRLAHHYGSSALLAPETRTLFKPPASPPHFVPPPVQLKHGTSVKGANPIVVKIPKKGNPK